MAAGGRGGGGRGRARPHDLPHADHPGRRTEELLQRRLHHGGVDQGGQVPVLDGEDDAGPTGQQGEVEALGVIEGQGQHHPVGSEAGGDEEVGRLGDGAARHRRVVDHQRQATPGRVDEVALAPVEVVVGPDRPEADVAEALAAQARGEQRPEVGPRRTHPEDDHRLLPVGMDLRQPVGEGLHVPWMLVEAAEGRRDGERRRLQG